MPAAILAAAKDGDVVITMGRRFHRRRAGEAGRWLNYAARSKPTNPWQRMCRGVPAARWRAPSFPPTSTTWRFFLGTVRHDEPLLLVGLGSNLLVRDGGFDGTAIFTHGALASLRREADGSFFAEAASHRPSSPASPANRAAPKPGSWRESPAPWAVRWR
jgi:hypothetical protein